MGKATEEVSNRKIKAEGLEFVQKLVEKSKFHGFVHKDDNNLLEKSKVHEKGH